MSSPATADKVCGFRVDPSSQRNASISNWSFGSLFPMAGKSCVAQAVWESFWAQRNGSNRINRRNSRNIDMSGETVIHADAVKYPEIYIQKHVLYSYSIHTIYATHHGTPNLYHLFAKNFGYCSPKSQIDQWPGLVAMYGGIVFGTSTRGIFSWPEILRTKFTWLYLVTRLQDTHPHSKTWEIRPWRRSPDTQSGNSRIKQSFLRLQWPFDKYNNCNCFQTLTWWYMALHNSQGNGLSTASKDKVERSRSRLRLKTSRSLSQWPVEVGSLWSVCNIETSFDLEKTLG